MEIVTCTGVAIIEATFFQVLAFFEKVIYFSLTGNCNVVLVSAVHQRGSAIGTHMSPPS